MALLFVINSEGFRVNNLIQLLSPANTWQANLTDGKLLWDFGRGSTPSQALEAAWLKIKTTEGVPGLEPGAPLPPIRRTAKKVVSIPDLDL
jgi:hypothetical protein